MRDVAVLFVCWGNTCRSPMAVGLAGLAFAGRISAESAGIEPGAAVSLDAVRVMRERGVDIAGHRPRAVQEVDLDRFALVVALSRDIGRWLSAHGVAADRLYVWDVADPLDRGLDAYRTCARALETLLGERPRG